MPQMLNVMHVSERCKTLISNVFILHIQVQQIVFFSYKIESHMSKARHKYEANAITLKHSVICGIKVLMLLNLNPYRPYGHLMSHSTNLLLFISTSSQIIMSHTYNDSYARTRPSVHAGRIDASARIATSSQISLCSLDIILQQHSSKLNNTLLYTSLSMFYTDAKCLTLTQCDFHVIIYVRWFTFL